MNQAIQEKPTMYARIVPQKREEVTIMEDFPKKRRTGAELGNNYCISMKGGRGVNITDVRVRKVNTAGKMRAIASITFDDAFVVRDIRVIEGHKGLFVAMPSRKTPDGQFRDIAHPVTQEARDTIEEAIISVYHELGN